MKTADRNFRGQMFTAYKTYWHIALFSVCVGYVAINFITSRKDADHMKPDSSRTETGHHSGVCSDAVQNHISTSPQESLGLPAGRNSGSRMPNAELAMEEYNALYPDASLHETQNNPSLTAPVLDDDFQVSDEIIDIMKLSDTQRKQIREITRGQLAKVQEREQINAEILEEIDGKVLSYKVPGSEEFAEECRMKFAEELKSVVGDSNYRMLSGQIEFLTRQLSRDLIVSYNIETNPDEGGAFYQFSVQSQELIDEASYGFDISGPMLAGIPSRWTHLFTLAMQ